MRARERKLRAVIAALLVAAQGCALAPEPTHDDIAKRTLANARIPATWSTANVVPGNVESGWLAQLDDPRLQALVEEALEFNSDLMQAAARVERAASYLKIAKGELYPAVYGIGRKGDESGSGIDAVMLSASWELDVWGRVRYGVRGTRDQFAAAQAEYAYARASLAALVAKSWFLAIEASLQRALVTDMVSSASTLVGLTEDRVNVGIGSDFDVASARVSLQTYRDSLQQIELSRQQALRALELLLGRYPAAELAPAENFPTLATAVPVGVPSELLERRPDVIAAERRVGAAFNLMRQARAARLPSLSLTGSGSDLSSDLFILQRRDEPKWSLGGRIIAPLFTGGSLRAQVKVRTAEQEEAMAAYAATVLKAFREVEDALSSEHAMQAREAILITATAEAQRAVGFAHKRYTVGSGDLRGVQQQQLEYHTTRMNLLRVQSERRIQRVNLHLALGGDFAPG